ncbi:C45 family autoproteolytic acyltransferase/hydolase [Oceanobacillus halophilus]|uniref:Linear amide C-N hydrolase n=1 Tax=Oceanobacillus halophilus TaxID=930130 RepID=A0A495A318_9BACI|nr:C45 family peptidase [Oceanobacillus halophilus]RKQ33915.1 linear amide C-N hydrolase [Oceanobacillus halophilus]
MREIFSDIIQFRGSHYDFGYMQGKQLKNSLIVKNRKKFWKLRRPRFTVNIQETKQILNRYAPGMWDELEGLQNAMEAPMNEILRDFGGYRINTPKSGCSIFTGKDYLIRNYDYHPKTYEGRYSIYQPSDQGYAVIGPQQRVTGRMDGMNEKGLAMGYNSIHRKKPGAGFVCHMIGRMILETCASVDEAIAFLKEIPHRHSFSYILLDKNNETYIVEATPRSVDIRQSHVCTNHFELQKDENKRILDDSYNRLNAMKKHKSEVSDVHTAFQMMNDTDKGVFSKEYKNWVGTIHTSAYLPKELKAWIALGGNQEPVVFDFEKWLQGENVTMEKFHGQIDTDLPFAHMD